MHRLAWPQAIPALLSLGFVLAGLLIALILPAPSPFQRGIVTLMSALMAAGAAILAPGRAPLHRESRVVLGLRGCGALASFAIAMALFNQLW